MSTGAATSTGICSMHHRPGGTTVQYAHALFPIHSLVCEAGCSVLQLD